MNILSNIPDVAFFSFVVRKVEAPPQIDRFPYLKSAREDVKINNDNVLHNIWMELVCWISQIGF